MPAPLTAGQLAAQRSQDRLRAQGAVPQAPPTAPMPITNTADPRPSVQPTPPAQPGGQLGQLSPQSPGQFAGTPILNGTEGQGQRIEDAMMARAKRMLDPQFEQQERQMQQQLVNRGLQPGTEAYDVAVSQFNRAKNDAYAQAQNQAITAGTQEQQRLLDQQYRYDALAKQEQMARLQFEASMGNTNAQMELSRMQFEASQQQQEWQNAMGEQSWNAQQMQQDFANQMAIRQMSQAERQQFFNEMGWFLGGQVPQTGMPTVNAPNVMGAFQNFDQGNQAAWQMNQQAAQQQFANQQAATGQLLQMGGMFAMMCHRELKEGIVPFEDGLSMIAKFPTYTFRYVGNQQGFIGPMLDETPEELKLGKDHVNVPSVVFALVSAVQTLTARLEALEARHAV